jgi:hypothetical protein
MMTLEMSCDVPAPRATIKPTRPVAQKRSWHKGAVRVNLRGWGAGGLSTILLVTSAKVSAQVVGLMEFPAVSHS